MEGISASVEKEPLLRVHGKGTHAEPGGHLVHLLPVHRQRGLAGVEIGVLHAVPQAHVGHGQGDVGPRPKGRDLPPGVQKPDLHLSAVHLMEGLHPDPAVLTVHGGRDLEAGTTEIVHVEVVLVHDHQQHIPVNPAVEGEVRLLRVHPVVAAVVRVDGEGVVLLENIRHIPAEGGVAPVVGPHLRPVELHLGGGVHPLELQVYPLVRPEVRPGKAFLVDARTPPVVVPAVLAVDGVPGVGHIHRPRLTVRAREGPALVQVYYRSHSLVLPRPRLRRNESNDSKPL